MTRKCLEIIEEIISHNEEKFEATKCFLNEIFLDLMMRTDENILNYATFHEFLQFPMIISEKMFDHLSQGKEILTRDQFAHSLSLLYFGPLKSKLKTVFHIFDFDHDNIISEQDIRLLLLHFHMSGNHLNEIQEIQEIVTTWVNSTDSMMDYQTFYESMIRNSDVFILFLFFLFKFRPFTERQIDYCHRQRKAPTKTFNLYTSLTSDDQIPLAVPSTRLIEYIETIYLDRLDLKNDGETCQKELLCFTTESEKVKQCKLVLIDNVLFFYKFNSRKGIFQLNKLFTLKSTFIIECEEVIIDNQSYFPFQLTSNFNSNQFLINFLGTDENKIKNFVDLIKCSSNDRNILDLYRFECEIGSGNYGRVQLGLSILAGEKVAIKIVEKNGKCKDDLRREVDIFKFLKNSIHPGIIQAIDIFENVNFIFFIYEYISGGDLKAYLKMNNNRITTNELKSLTNQLIDAVGFLHQFGIIHRDIKPANILVKETKEGEIVVKITDFGLSKVIGFNEKTTEPYGSLIYTAPEIILGIPYNHQVDVWSLGIVMYNMLTGCYPFSEVVGHSEKVKEAIVTSDFKFPESETNSSSLFSLVESGLTKNYVNRPRIEDIISMRLASSY